MQDFTCPSKLHIWMDRPEKYMILSIFLQFVHVYHCIRCKPAWWTGAWIPMTPGIPIICIERKIRGEHPHRKGCFLACFLDLSGFNVPLNFANLWSLHKDHGGLMGFPSGPVSGLCSPVSGHEIYSPTDANTPQVIWPINICHVYNIYIRIYIYIYIRI